MTQGTPITGTSKAAWAALALACALALGGCGTRSSLENPARPENAGAAGATGAATTASADSGQGKKEDEAPKPHKGFILDGLIR